MEPPAAGPTTSWLRQSRASSVARGLGTTAIVVVAGLSMTTAIAFASQEAEAQRSGSSMVLVLAWLVGMVLVAALVVRRRFPVQVCVAGAVGAVLLPIDSLAALVALAWVVARRPPRAAVLCGALVALGTGAALARDARRSPENTILSARDQLTGQDVVLPAWGYVMVGLMCLATAIGVGLLRRWRETAVHAVDLQQREARVADGLRTEMTRQEERDVIAREVHDTVAHQLSLVSLRAAALEVSADEDGDVREAARTMRSAAHQALEEMRELITVLRSPPMVRGQSPGPAHGATLADLPTMLDSARDAGARIRSTVFVSDAGQAPAGLTRAVYRIVQESLTNALKHAPGAEVTVDLRAGPDIGVWLRVLNPLPTAPSSDGATSPADLGPTRWSGAGVTGMRERAALLGGELEAGGQGGWFVVTAQLPWQAGQPSAAAS